MSYFVAPDTGTKYAIFGEGGGAKVAEEFGVPLLARIPLEMDTRKGGDAGVPIVVGQPRSAQAAAFLALAASGRRARRGGLGAQAADHRLSGVRGGQRLPPDLSAAGPDVLPPHAAAAARLRGALPRHGHGLPRARPAHGRGRAQAGLRGRLRRQARRARHRGSGRIVQCERLATGRFNILLKGERRVRIERELPADTLYRMVAATPLADVGAEGPTCWA